MKVYRLKKASFALLTGTLFFILTGSIFGQNMFRKINDFDGDGKADFIVTRNTGGYKYWYIWTSQGMFRALQWGTATDLETAGDYNGDGKTDLSAYRMIGGACFPQGCQTPMWQYWIYFGTTNTWEGRMMSESVYGVQTFSFAQDYTGDGVTDLGVVFNRTPEQGNPYIRYIADRTIYISKFYNQGDTPVRVGDLTGDGKADIVTVSPTNLVTIRNTATDALQTKQFGVPGDQFVPADFDGDGKGDLAVFRESEGVWWWIRSSDGAMHAAQFGQSGDKPVPADYDGDGKTDLAIWRPGTLQSIYWVYGSQSGVFAVQWGLSSDTVVTY